MGDVVDGFCDVGTDDDGFDDVGCEVEGLDVDGARDVGVDVAVSSVVVALVAVELVAVALIGTGSKTTPESKISICNRLSSKMLSSSRVVRFRLVSERRLALFLPSRPGGRAELSAAAAVRQAAENCNLIVFSFRTDL